MCDALRHVVGPTATTPSPWPYRQPTWVFSSRHLPSIPGADIRFVEGDVRPVHTHLVAARTSGSSAAANWWGEFYDHGLLDEVIVQIGSVTLGSGKPLLPRAITSPPLQLTQVRKVGSGFAELYYEVPKPSRADDGK
jgi:hypothetical protein